VKSKDPLESKGKKHLKRLRLKLVQAERKMCPLINQIIGPKKKMAMTTAHRQHRKNAAWIRIYGHLPLSRS
jgi:hypothetical protein